MSHFCKELLKQDRRSIGRFDARYQGIESSAASASPSFDPSLAGVRAPYTSTFNNYVRVELGYKTDVPYYILGEGVGRWDWQREMGYPATTERPARRDDQKPSYEGLDRLWLLRPRHPLPRRRAYPCRPGIRSRFCVKISRLKRYDSGHMMYVHGPSLHKLKHDGVALIDRKTRGK